MESVGGEALQGGGVARNEASPELVASEVRCRRRWRATTGTNKRILGAEGPANYFLRSRVSQYLFMYYDCNLRKEGKKKATYI